MYPYNRFSIVLLILAAIVPISFGQKLAAGSEAANAMLAPSAAVEPVLFEGPGQSGNPNCADLNARHVNGVGDMRFSHIVTDNQLKLDFETPNGTFPFTSGNGREVVGPQDPNHFVTLSSAGSAVFSWSSTRPITAVMVKVGNDSYVYPYKPFRSSDTDLITGDHRTISHVTFCFGEGTSGGSTAGEGSISGRVIDAGGNGIAKAQLVLINGATGESKITMTSTFGYFTFTGLGVNELYVLNVRHKRFTFGEKQRTVSLSADLADVQFVAQPVH